MPSGVEVRKVNYDDPSSLVSALQGQDLVVSTMSTFASNMQSKLVEAAGEAQVPWVFPSVYGNDTDDDLLNNDILVGAEKKAARQRIEQLGMSWMGIACGLW